MSSIRLNFSNARIVDITECEWKDLRITIHQMERDGTESMPTGFVEASYGCVHIGPNTEAASGSGTATLAPAPNWFPPREEVNDLNTGTSAGVYADGWNACIKSFRENFITNPGTPATPSAPDDGIVHLQMEPICNHPDCLIAAQAYAAAAVEREREECASIEGRPIPQEQRIAHAEGSLFNLPQFEGFKYTGFRIPEVGEYFVSGSVSKNPLEWLPGSHEPLMCTTSDVHAEPRYILRKLPAAQSEAMISDGHDAQRSEERGFEKP